MDAEYVMDVSTKKETKSKKEWLIAPFLFYLLQDFQ